MTESVFPLVEYNNLYFYHQAFWKYSVTYIKTKISFARPQNPQMTLHIPHIHFTFAPHCPYTQRCKWARL